MFCGLQGVGTVAIDLTRTHAKNPVWTPHARFHSVWQVLTMVLLAGVEVGLLWGGWVDEGQGFYLALVLAAVAAVAFLVTCVVRAWFDARLADVNGVPPVRLRVRGRVWEVDLNLVVEIVSLAVLGTIVAIYRR